MANKPILDPEKLNEYSKLLDEAWAVLKRLNDLHQTLSVQEKVLTGGFVFQGKNPWKDINLSVMAGDREVVTSLINRVVNYLRQPVAQTEKPIFGDGKDGGKILN